jgi:hypothetical protein
MARPASPRGQPAVPDGPVTEENNTSPANLPLTRSASSLQEELLAQGVPQAQANQMAVRESLQIALQVAFRRIGIIWLCTCFALLAGLFGLVVWSYDVFQQHSEDACDMPLASILELLYMLIFVLGFRKCFIKLCCCFDPDSDGPLVPGRVKAFKAFSVLATLFWPLLALYCLSQTRKCSEDLKTVVRVLAYYSVLVSFVLVILPACYLSLMLCLVRHGLVRAPRSGTAAPEGFIEQLPVIPYDPANFSDGTDKYPTCCPICLDPFDAEQGISQTPCNHVYHKNCLNGWLQTSRTCPLCRTDVTGVEESA